MISARVYSANNPARYPPARSHAALSTVGDSVSTNLRRSVRKASRFRSTDARTLLGKRRPPPARFGIGLFVEPAQIIEVRGAHRAPALLQVVNDLHEAPVQRDRAPVLLGRPDDDPDLIVDLRAAVAHREIPPDAALLLEGRPVEGRQPVEALVDGGPVAGLGEPHRVGVVAVKPLAAHALGIRDPDDFPRQVGQERPRRRVRQHVGDRLVDDRCGEEHRAVPEFSPQIAPDVRGERGVLEEGRAQDAAQLLEPRGDLAVQLAEIERPAAAVKGARPSIARPSRRIASTCSATVSTKSTSWPARTRCAPTVPPIAPAPTTVKSIWVPLLPGAAGLPAIASRARPSGHLPEFEIAGGNTLFLSAYPDEFASPEFESQA